MPEVVHAEMDLMSEAHELASARGELFETYRNYLRLLARVQIGRRLQSKVDASDLVQETLLEAHRDFSRFAGSTEGELCQWLRAILAHRISKLVRYYYGTQRRDIRLEQQLERDLENSSAALERGLAASNTSPSQQMVRHESAIALANALENLSPRYRDVLVLRHLAGLSFAEVAEQLGRSVESVKHLWSRGLGKLRIYLRDSL